MRLTKPLLAATAVILSLSATTQADENAHAKAVAKAINYLRTTGQAADGSFSKQVGPAVTAICVTAIMQNGRSPDDPVVAKGLKYLEKFVAADGGIHMKGTTYRNYDTSLSLVCFVAANKDGRYNKIIKKADSFLKKIQWDKEEGHDEASFSHGGAGYGKHKRPDLNNTAHLIEALKAAGNGADSEAMKKALLFVSRCQNLETEHNKTPFSTKVQDGGFYYTPAAGGSNPDLLAKTAAGALRSYGSMTYSGLKSMIYAGLKKDDPRVKAAVTWAGKNYDLTSNPGLGAHGYFYYVHTLAKALDAAGEDIITDAQGKKHDWRKELTAELVRRQAADGSWLNKTPRWLEGDPNLVTGYALMTLSHCRPKK